MRSSKNRGKHYLQCSNRHVAKDACIGSFISVDKLEQMVIDELNRLSGEYLNKDDLERKIEFAGNLQAQKDSIQGRVIVQFTIKKTGEVSNATVIRSVSPELDAEAIRVVKSMPDWKPGEQKGEPVNVKFTLPIQFRLTGETK